MKKLANRFRAILVALVITIAANYAISYAAKDSPQSNSPGISTERSGSTPTPSGFPKP
jgi:hypothetical protein